MPSKVSGKSNRPLKPPVLWEGWGILSPKNEVCEGFKTLEYATGMLAHRPAKYKLVRMVAFLQPVRLLRPQNRATLKNSVDKVRK
jgi:hypothetical protein